MYVPKAKKLSSGLWRVRVRVNGEELMVYGETERDATNEARLRKAEMLAGVVHHTGETLGQVVDRYLTNNEPVLSPSSVRGFRSVRRVRFTRYMDLPVNRIDFQKMISEETRIVAPKTVKCAWGLVRRALKTEAGMTPVVRLPQVPVKEIPYLQPEEIKPFLDALKGNIAEVPALLELHGLRRSEMMALRYEDITDVINVRGAVVQDSAGQYVKKQTNKNRTSTRTVPVFVPRLAELVKGKTGPVMTIGTNTLYSNIRRCCEAAGVTVVGNHGLRHSFASLAYHIGLSERQLMSLGGWADYGTMHRVYIRLAESDRKAAGDVLKSFFS